MSWIDGFFVILGSPVVFVLIAYLWDANVYRNDNVDFCVMTATKAPIVYYMTYFGEAHN